MAERGMEEDYSTINRWVLYAPKLDKRFFRKMFKTQHTQAPRVVTVDKNAAYPSRDSIVQGEH
jgi:transposase-like protein